MSNAFSLAKFSRLLKSTNAGKEISIDSSGDPVLVGGAAIAVSATSTLVGSSIVERFVQLSGTGPYTITLPAASELGSGQGFGLICTASGTITIQRQGTDQIYHLLNYPVNSFTVLAGDFLWMERQGNTWNITDGSTTLQYTPQFGASLSASGYQKLPSGLIIQWGITSGIANSSNAAVTFPVTFPNTVFQAIAGSNSSGNNSLVYTVSTYNITTSGMNVSNNSSTSGSVSARWIAIGN